MFQTNFRSLSVLILVAILSYSVSGQQSDHFDDHNAQSRIPLSGGESEYRFRQTDDRGAVICNDLVESDAWWRAIHATDHVCHTAYNLNRKENCESVTKLKVPFFTEEQKTKLCAFRCSGFEEMCRLRIAYSGVNKIDLKAKIVDGFEWLLNDFEGDVSYEPIMSDDVVQQWFDFIMMSLPVLFSVVPILLNQYAYLNMGVYIISMLGLVCCWIFLEFTNVMFIYNLLIWLLCLIADPGRGPIREVMVSYALMIVTTLCVFVNAGAPQFFFGILTLLIYIVYLRAAFFDKRTAKTQTGVLIVAQAMVSGEQMLYLATNFNMISFPSVMIRMVLNVILPMTGSNFFFVNVINLAKSGLYFVDKQFELRAFMGLVIMQFIGFIVYRCSFGMYVITSLRFKMSFENFFMGGIMYTADLFGGICYLGGLCFKIEVFNARRLTYSIVNVIMLYCEFLHMREYLFVRCIVWSFDYVFNDSALTSAPRFLGARVDMCGRAFPQRGENVWIGLGQMIDVARHVKKLKAKIKDNWYSGLGVVLRYGNDFRLLTIDHVGSCSEMKIEDLSLMNPKVTKLSGSDDPIVSIDLPEWELDGASIRLLSNHEVDDIVQTFVVSLPDDGMLEPMIMMSSKFLIDKKGDLRVYGSLKEGDSGGPIFAALKNGTIRYAGAVSRATDARGIGHCYSLITSPLTGRLDSDSDSEPGNTAVIRFNRERGNLNQRLKAQQKLGKVIDEFGVWIVDVAKEKGYKWVADDDGVAIDLDHPHQKGQDKVNYDRRKKNFRAELRAKLSNVRSVAEIALENDAEVERLIDMLRKNTKIKFDGRSLVSIGDYGPLIDDNPGDY